MRGDGRFVRDAGWQVGSRVFSAFCVVMALLLGAFQPWHMLVAQFAGTVAFGFLITRYLRVKPLIKPRADVYRTILPLAWIDLACVLYFRADMVLFQFLAVSKIDVG